MRSGPVLRGRCDDVSIRRLNSLASRPPTSNHATMRQATPAA